MARHFRLNHLALPSLREDQGGLKQAIADDPRSPNKHFNLSPFINDLDANLIVPPLKVKI